METDPRNLWQEQEAETVMIAMDEIRTRAAKFERRISQRNLREYVAGAIVIAIFLFQAWHAEGWQTARPLLYAAGGMFIMFQLYRRAGLRPVRPDCETAEFLRCHLAELERQRDALRSVWLWYLLPLVPGFAAETVLNGVDHGFGAGVVRRVLILIVLLAGVWRLNVRAADRIERRIQELRMAGLPEGPGDGTFKDE